MKIKNNMKIIGKGAEAVVYCCNNSVIKERIKKNYRIREIDETLRKKRTRREAKVIEKLNRINLPAPKLIACDDNSMKIEMEFIRGKKVRDIINRDNCQRLCKEIGRHIATMHNHGIIHGDLTTSNMIYYNNKIYFIDFGLSFFSEKIEDKAVDLHLLRQALESKHSELYAKCFEAVLEGYRENNPHYDRILKRFRVVEKRGRNKKKG